MKKIFSKSRIITIIVIFIVAVSVSILLNNNIFIPQPSLAEAGIGIAFVSNNDWERVDRFNATLGVPAYAKSGKPFKKNLVRAMNDLGGTLETTVMLGDQLLTDALAGHNLGVKCLIVPPIRDKKNAFFRFKRWLEKPVVKKFKRRNGIEW